MSKRILAVHFDSHSQSLPRPWQPRLTYFLSSSYYSDTNNNQSV